MEKWLAEFIKKWTKGHWRRNENIFEAALDNVMVRYIPLTEKAEVVIRVKNEHGEWPAISPFFHVDTEEWAWVKQDAVANSLLKP
jgi:hypothetical protein